MMDETRINSVFSISYIMKFISDRMLGRLSRWLRIGYDTLEISKQEKGTDFWICDNCGQAYWKGTHWKNIMELSKME